MAKDPAFLFYSSDFLTGTALMAWDEVGKYMYLMCYQHQFGRLTEKQVLAICKTENISELSPVLEKFKRDRTGRFYNKRLADEIEKREKFTESRRKNARGKRNTEKACAKHMPEHMDDHMENRNENKDLDLLARGSEETKGKVAKPKEVAAFWESVWKLYPKKRGKGQVSDAQKQKLYGIGIEQLGRCIERYSAEQQGQDMQYWQSGSTFFNSGYVDYLDENCETTPPEAPPDYTIKPDTSKPDFQEGAAWQEILATLDD